MHKKTLSLVNDLYSSIYICENQAAILSATKHIKAATNIIKAVCSNPQNKVLSKELNFPPNVNSVKQLQFLNKQTKKKTVQLPKLSFEQEISSHKKLSTFQAKFCAICFEEDDSYERW